MAKHDLLFSSQRIAMCHSFKSAIYYLNSKRSLAELLKKLNMEERKFQRDRKLSRVRDTLRVDLVMENLSHDFHGRANASAGSKLFDCPSRVAAALSPGRSCPVPLKSQLCEARHAAKTVEAEGERGPTATFSRVSVKNWSFKRLTMGAERIDRGFTFISNLPPPSRPFFVPPSEVSPPPPLFLFFSRFSAARDCRIVEGVRPFQTYPFSSRTPFNATKTNCLPRARSAKDEVDTTGEIVPRCSLVFRLAFRGASRWFSRWCDWKIFTKTQPAGCILLFFFLFLFSSWRITPTLPVEVLRFGTI